MAKGIKKLLRERPNSGEVEQLLAEITADSPRGAAMIAAALTDDILLGTIRFRLVNDDESDDLFGSDRPLGTFSARIRLGYAMGIFGRKTRHDLRKSGAPMF